MPETNLVKLKLLDQAFADNNRSIWQKLLSDFPINTQDHAGKTALISAIQSQNNYIVNHLLKFKKPDVNLSMHNGQTPLMVACSCYNDAVSLLLKERVSLETIDIYGWTALFYAAKHSPKSFDALIKNGGNVNAKNELGQTPLTILFHYRPTDFNAIKTLLDSRSELNTQDNLGFTPFMQMAKVMRWVNKDETKKVLDYLVKAGLDLTIKNNVGKTALDIIRQLNQYNEEIFKFLLLHEEKQKILKEGHLTNQTIKLKVL